MRRVAYGGRVAECADTYASKQTTQTAAVMADAAMVFHLKVQVLMDMAHGHCSEEKWG